MNNIDELLIWLKILKSELYFEIFKKFREINVEIPFPQRDMHLKSGFEKYEKNKGFNT